MPRTFKLSYRDASNEVGTVSMYLDDGADDTAKTNIINAVNALTLGILQETADSIVTRVSNSIPTNNAEREMKLQVQYQDNVTLNKYVVSLPTFDQAGATRITNTDYYSITTANLTAFVTAFQTSCVSPDGNAVTVLQAKFVGVSS